MGPRDQHDDPPCVHYCLSVVCCLLSGLVVSGCSREPEGDSLQSARPNILLIVADDMGYSDAGVFGSEIQTPNIDALAAEGLTLTQFHVSPNCGPTRGAMMTGVDPHRAGLGGPGWAYAAATPLRLFKGYVAQGGIQVPAVIKLPSEMANAGTRSDHLTHVMDLMPTFLSVARADYPQFYNGESITPLQGKSLIPLLRGNASVEVEPRELGWSAYGMDAYRRGNWKILRLPEPYGSGGWQLYDLADAPGELHSLSSEFPDRVGELARAWEDYAESNGVIRPSAATAYARPVVGRKY